MFQIFKKIDWIQYNWINQVIFFLMICVVTGVNWANQAIRENGWIFMAVYTLIFALSCINALCLHNGRAREIVAISIVIALVFIIPMTYYSLGGSLEVTSAASLIFVLLSITMSPLIIGAGILAAALCYAAFIHYNNFFEQHPVFREGLGALSMADAAADVITPVSTKNVSYFMVKTPASLQEISSYEAVYGNKDYWKALYDANRKQLDSPLAEVPAGTKLAVPAARGRPYRISTFTVPREAGLKEISAMEEVYNDPRHWKYLYEANKSKVIDTRLTVLGGTRLIVPELPPCSHFKFLLISLIYVAAALIGLCWRILLQELYNLLAIALSASTGQTLAELSMATEKITRLREENRRMRREIAMHVVEIDYIINYREPESEQKSG